MTPTELFLEAIAASGITPPKRIIADGLIHRFSSDGRSKDEAGWYVLYLDGVPAGAFGCWRNDLKQPWCSKAIETMTETERQAHRVRLDDIKKQRNQEDGNRHAQAGQVALKRWKAANQATEHPYLTTKGVKAYGVKLEGEALLIPMRDTESTLHSLQVIDPEGGKRFQSGGRVKGCYHAIGKPEGVLIVCEGYATGASIHEATGHAVAVAFNAGNLRPVAEALHAKYPALRLVVAADDDWKTEGNPGLTKAKETAQVVGSLLAVPKFPDWRSEKDSDFNDLYQMGGADVVRACFDFSTLKNESVGWSEPTPLPDSLPVVAPFEPELLPETLRDWVTDIAHRMQCPTDFTAVGLVVAISSLIGARAVVAPKVKDDWRVVPNLWGLVVGRPGVKKSPALGEVLKPLFHLEATERARWQEAHSEWAIDAKVAEMAGRENEKAASRFAAKDPAKARALLGPVNLPDEPKARRYVVNDSSVEKLADMLTVNEWGLLVYRDEIHSLLCSMNKQGQEGARGFYLTGYDGNQGHAVDRIGRGESYVKRVCLSMLGGIQPGKLQSYVREAVGGGDGDDGLLQRFGLAVFPDVNQEFVYVDQWPNTHAKQAVNAVFERLNQLQPVNEPEEWRFSNEAQALFVEWLEPFETEIRGDELHPALVSHLSKYRKLIPALALIFALVDTPDSGNVIHERELLRALAWGDYLRTHAERIYSAAVMPETTGARQLLDKIKSGKLCTSDGVLLDCFTPRQVAVKHWAGLTTPDAVRKAADLLTDYGWLARETVPAEMTGGRPKEHYLVHPTLLNGGK